MNKKNIIMLIVIAVIFAFVGFYLFNKSSTDTSTLTADSKATPAVGAQDIYNSLQKMAKVKLDDSIFSNQVFQSLKDNSIDVPPQETRGSNPFAPINSVTVTGPTISR